MNIKVIEPSAEPGKEIHWASQNQFTGKYHKNKSNNILELTVSSFSISSATLNLPSTNINFDFLICI